MLAIIVLSIIMSMPPLTPLPALYSNLSSLGGVGGVAGVCEVSSWSQTFWIGVSWWWVEGVVVHSIGSSGS